jgi:hypothetical protein
MFENTIGLWALLSLVPFIILYLRRPRPQDRVVPSLMFLIKDRKKSQKYSFLRRLMNNFLFFLQLLALLLLSVSVAAPYIRLPYDATLENTVIVLDASASMQAKDGISRFDKALKEAKKALSGKNSIILAENMPLIVLEDESTPLAMDLLSKLKPKATTTNLGDAMLLAKDILGERPGRVVVISDFSNVDGPDLLVVKKTLAAENIVVDFIDVSNKVENIGITKIDATKHSMKVYIKNFKDSEESVTLKLIQHGKELSSSGSIKILPKSVETFVFDEVPPGVSTIVLEPKDGFELDNVAYISAPLKKQIDVLLITNKKNSNIELALDSSKDINLCVVNPPVLTICTSGDRNGQRVEPYNQDIIIVHEINNVGERNGILPGTFVDISAYVKKGGRLIITAQDNLDKINMYDGAIVNLKGMVNKPTKVCVDVINQFTKQFERDICFATTGKYFGASLKNGAITVASALDKTPIIVVGKLNKGKIAYYGIFDDESEFKTLPSYPIFWNSFVNFMVETENINEFNYKTGKILTIPLQTVKTPSGPVRTSKVIMDEAGIYEFNSRKVAANLLDEKESDLASFAIEKGAKKEVAFEKQRKEHNFGIASFLLLIAFLLLSIETVYIKRRGDI